MTQFAFNEDAYFWAEDHQDFPGCKQYHAYLLKMIAWSSDDSGHCFLTRAQLVEKIGLSDRTVQRKLKDLEAANLIRIAPDRYVLLMFEDETPRQKRPSYLRLVET